MLDCYLPSNTIITLYAKVYVCVSGYLNDCVYSHLIKSEVFSTYRSDCDMLIDGIHLLILDFIGFALFYDYHVYLNQL